MLLACLASMPAKAQSPLEQDLAQIMAWWPGTYNNDEQVAGVEERMGEENFTGEVWRLDGSGMGGYLNVTSPLHTPGRAGNRRQRAVRRGNTATASRTRPIASAFTHCPSTKRSRLSG